MKASLCLIPLFLSVISTSGFAAPVIRDVSDAEIAAHVNVREQYLLAREAQQAYLESTNLEDSISSVVTNRYRPDSKRDAAREAVASACGIGTSQLQSGMTTGSPNFETTTIEEVGDDGGPHLVQVQVVKVQVTEEINCGTEVNQHVAKLNYNYSAQYRDGKYVQPRVDSAE